MCKYTTITIIINERKKKYRATLQMAYTIEHEMNGMTLFNDEMKIANVKAQERNTKKNTGPATMAAKCRICVCVLVMKMCQKETRTKRKSEN